MFLFFDTETNGLPADYNAPATDTDNWPRIVQLAYSVRDRAGKTLFERDVIIRPDGWEIPDDMIHGISHAQALQDGVPVAPEVTSFLDWVEKCDYLVAHNLNFDYPVFAAEYIRAVRAGTVQVRKAKIEKICTMRSTVEFCKIPGRFGKYKWPRLSELHGELFGCDFEGAHNAMFDVDATVKCFFELMKREVIKIK